MKVKRLFKRAVSVLLVLCTLLSVTGSAFAQPVLEPQLIPGERMVEEPGESAVYFGVIEATLEEMNSLYEVQIFRTGDLSEALDIEVHTLDVTALYGEDYVLRGKGLEVLGGEMTQLERNATQDLRIETEEIPAEEQSAEGVPASEVSSLAALKEAQTGEKTRSLVDTEALLNMSEQMQELLIPDVSGVLDSAAVLPLHFDAGQDELRVQIEILDDENSEIDELFSLFLGSLGDLEQQGSNTCSLMIADNEPDAKSVISFSASEYAAQDGYAKVTLRRESMEESMADVRIRSVGATAVEGTDYTPIDETVTFLPYETEVTVLAENFGTGGYTLELSEFKGCDPGEVTSAQITAAPVVREPMVKAASAPQETPVLMASETQTAAEKGLSFNISIGGKSYKVEYDNVNATMGKIYDEGYEPKLWVGNYFFPVDNSKARGGWFQYNIFTGKEPWGCGTRASEYCVESEAAADQNYGRLRYYHTSTWRKGTAEMLMEEKKLTSIPYQYFAPDWASISSFGGGQRSQFILRRANSDSITKEVKGQFDRTLNSGAIAVGNTSGGTLTYPSDRWVQFEVKAVDSEKNKTPKSFVNAYGFAAMFKRYDVSMETSEKLSYMTLSGASSPVEAAQVTVKCGAQQAYDHNARSIFVNTDAKSSNLVFSVGNNHINGHDGKFAKIVGYTITVGSGTNKTTLQYPEGLIDFINKAEFQNNSCIDYSAGAKQSAIEQIRANLDTIPMNDYFISWIEHSQKQVTASGAGYYQTLVFKPKLGYYDVQVQVKENELASFKSALLTPGTHTFHGGDFLNMDAEVLSDRHYLAGFEYSLNGGVDYYFVPASDKTLFLEPYNSYIVRPVVAEINNYIEVEMTDAAKEHLEVINTVPAESLADHNVLAGKTLMMCNTAGKTVYDQMLPEVSTAYQISVKVKDGHEPASGKVFVATFYDPVTEQTYTGNVFNHIAKTRIDDNRLVLDVKEVNESELLEFDIESTLLCKARPVRATGLTEKLVPMEGRLVSVANGDLSKDPEQISYTSQEDGKVSLYGVKAVAGSMLRILISDGMSEAQIYDLQVPQDMTGDGTVYTPEKIEIGYAYSYPKVYDVLYDYGKNDNNQNSDNTQNSVNIYDDDLTVMALLDDKGKQIKRVEFVVETVTGTAIEYAAAASEHNPGEYTAIIRKMLDKLYNGDRMYVRVIGSYTASDGTETEIIYPMVDTGIVFYLENAIKVPQDYEVSSNTASNISVLGKASGKSSANLLSFNRTNWEDGCGYTLDINLTVPQQSNAALSTKDKAKKLDQFQTGISEAAAADQEFKSAFESMLDARHSGDKSMYEGNYDNAITYYQYEERFKEMVDSLPKDNCQKMQGKLNSAAPVLSINGAFMLQLNFVYHPETNEYVIAYTSLGFGVMGTVAKTWYCIVGSVPVFFNLSIVATFDIIGSWASQNNKEENLSVISESEFQKYPGNLEQLLDSNQQSSGSIATKITGNLGAGMANVLSARGGATIVLQLDWAPEGTGFIFGITMTASVDLFVGSISFDLVSATLGSGIDAGKTGVKYFGGLADDGRDDAPAAAYSLRGTAPAAAADEPEEKILAKGEDGTVMTYQEASAGTADMSAFGGRPGMVRATLEAVSKNILLENAADRTRPQLIKLDDGRMLLTFIGARSAEDPTQVLYYAYHDGIAWGQPQIVSDDGTFDSTPSMLKVGDKVVISWADAKRTFTEKDTAKTKLQSLEIAYAVLNTKTGTMGEEIIFTDDTFFNFAPRLSLAGNKVYCSYMKRDIEAVTKEDDLLNFEGLYSTMAFVSYDLADGSKQGEQFITLRHPTMTDPLTMDYNSQTIEIGGTTYLVSAYTVDEDMKISTQEGKALWVEITDLNAEKAYYPIRLSEEGASITSPHLDALNDGLYLTYVENGEQFCLMDLGGLIRDLFEEEVAGDVYRDSSGDDETWYKQTAQDLGMDAETYEDSVYDRLSRDEFPVDAINFNVDEESTSTPGEFVLTTNGDDLYVFFTDNNKKEPTLLGNELFGARYALDDPDDESDDFEESGFSKASQITNYGKTIDELSVVMDEYNVVNVVANYYAIEPDAEGHLQIGANSLAEFKFVPSDSLTVVDYSVEFEDRMVAGEQTQVKLGITNDGVLPTTGYDLTVKLEQGGGETEVYSVTRNDLHLDTGETNEETFLMPVTEDLEEATLNFYVREHDTNNSYQKWVGSAEVPYGADVQIDEMTFVEENGETYLDLKYENKGNKTGSAIAAKTDIITDDGGETIRTIDTFEIPALASGETFSRRVKLEPEVSDFNDFGMIYVKNTGEADGENVFSRMNYKTYTAPTTVQLGGADAVELEKGEKTKLDVQVEPYASLAGKAVFSSSDPKVATVDENGNVTAVGGGNAEITVIYPEVGLSETITVTVEGEQERPDDPERPGQSKPVIDRNEDEDEKAAYDAFRDLLPNAWYREGVEYALNHGIMNGVSDSLFAPNDPTSRAMLVTMLWRMEEKPNAGKAPFRDVAAGSWYADAVAWAAKNQIVTGYDETTFGPNDPVTREQMATILYRYAVYNGMDTVTMEENLDAFADNTKVSSYASAAMNWAVGQQLINGIDGKLAPQGQATRAQVATILMRYLTQ